MNPNAYKDADPNVMKHFSSLATAWWDAHGSMRTLHDINPTRLAYIQEIIGDFSQKRILDVGCGGGILSEGMAKAGAQVTGLDTNLELIQVAKEHANLSQLHVDYQHKSISDLQTQTPFDVITCLELLEHVQDPLDILIQCRRLIKPNGILILSTINRHPKAFLFAILGAEYILKLIPRGTHHYEKFIKPSELNEMISKAQFQGMDLRGLHYQPLTHQSKLTHDMSVNYFLSATAL